MWLNHKLLIIVIFYLWKTNSVLLHTRLEKAINLYDIYLLSSEIDIKKQNGYDERFPIDNTENVTLLIEIIKNNERIRKILYLESIKNSCDEIKIQAVKDISDEGDIRPMSNRNGGLYNNWLLDEEMDD